MQGHEIRFLREPLLHFALLGAALFIVYGWVSEDEPGLDSPHIVIDAAEIERLVSAWEGTRQRPPTPDELRGLIDEQIREEIYYREALAMGLDRDDLIVRRRLRQKLEFLSEDVAAFVEPTDEELEEYLAKNPEPFRVSDRYSLEHVFVNEEAGRDAAAERARSLLEKLRGAGPELDARELGDRTLLPATFEDASERDLERQLGPVFVVGVAELPVGSWAGPVESGYGLHLVRVRDRTPGRMPQLSDIRATVEREWRSVRRREITEAFFQKLRERYEVTVEVSPRGSQ